jgi:hypothetical protein
MSQQIKRHFPGGATLEETSRACVVEVINGQPKKLLSVEGVVHNSDDGSSQNVNEVTFEIQDDPLAVLTVLNDFLFVDVSTPEGASDAAAASNDRTNIGGTGAEFSIWAEDRLIPVQILGQHTT